MNTIGEISNEMNQQDNRATQYPLYVIQSLQATGTPEDYEEFERNESESSEQYLCDDCKEMDGDLPDICKDCDDKAFLFLKYAFAFDR